MKKDKKYRLIRQKHGFNWLYHIEYLYIYREGFLWWKKTTKEWRPILVNNKWFYADLEELRELANKLNIDLTKIEFEYK